MEKRSSQKIIFQAIAAVLCLLFGIILGTVVNKYVVSDGHETHWEIVIPIACLFAIGAVIWAIIKIKKQDG